MLNKIYAKHTGKKASDVEPVMERDTYFSAHDAQAWGLVDEVIARRPSSTLVGGVPPPAGASAANGL